MSKIFIVDDDKNMCELIQDALEQAGFEVQSFTDPEDALTQVDSQIVDVLLTDVKLGAQKMSGLEVCERIVDSHPDIPVVVMTAFGTMETAIAAIRVGAYDFLQKPLNMNRLKHTIRRAVSHRELSDEVTRLRKEIEMSVPSDNLIGDSRPMTKVHNLISQVANSDVSVLISGESGTGKELIAKAIHQKSDRSDKPFVAVNCAAMPATLLESELFGHVKGAFTDAKSSRDGLFVQADGGTLLLDEIGEMPMEMQAKLLRVLQEHKVRPVGAEREVAFDTRIISATNRDIESDIEDGRFREDLFYRINVVSIKSPPLRSRGNDILKLAQFFLDHISDRTGKGVRGITADAARKLIEYNWPGNVRELENSIERAVTLTQYDEITVEDLPDKVKEHESKRIVIQGDDPDELPTLEEVECRYIRRVLDAVGQNKTHAAQVLGLDRRTLYRRLERYDIKD